MVHEILPPSQINWAYFTFTIFKNVLISSPINGLELHVSYGEFWYADYVTDKESFGTS